MKPQGIPQIRRATDEETPLTTERVLFDKYDLTQLKAVSLRVNQFSRPSNKTKLSTVSKAELTSSKLNTEQSHQLLMPDFYFDREIL